MLIQRKPSHVCLLKPFFNSTVNSFLFAGKRYIFKVVAYSFIFLYPGKSDESWAADVVGPAVNIITTFLSDNERMVPKLEDPESTSKESIQRDLWTQYTCKVCNGFRLYKFKCFFSFGDVG